MLEPLMQCLIGWIQVATRSYPREQGARVVHSEFWDEAITDEPGLVRLTLEGVHFLNPFDAGFNPASL
jgi:hypothetical protein